MGIQLTSIVKGTPLKMEELFDKTVAVDSFNWLYQFLSIIRQRDGEPLMDSSGNITSHLSGIFYRSLKLMDAGINLVYVFDGEPPKLKEKTSELRREARIEAKKKWEAARERGDEEEARKYAMRSSSITNAMLEESKELLEAMGIPSVNAPSEGEALCSVMTQKGDAYAAATQDYDSFLFGCPRVLRNLSISNVKKAVFPEIILLSDLLSVLGINRDQLIMLGILVGTDYNPGGVRGIGPKKALDLVKKCHTVEELAPGIKWEFNAEMKEIFEFFKSPQDADYDIKFGSLDEKKIKSILCDRHDFSEERIDSALSKAREKADNKQKSLNKWF